MFEILKLALLAGMLGAQGKALRYMPIGDSYTIGQSLPAGDNFPAQLTRALILKGRKVELVANPARTGWTSQDALQRELPLLAKAKPDFSTLCIGVNDWVQNVDPLLFRKRLRLLLDGMLRALGSPRRLILLSIPDFSATPAGEHYNAGRDISAGIASFNAIIEQEALIRHLVVVDIFPGSQGVKGPPGAGGSRWPAPLGLGIPALG